MSNFLVSIHMFSHSITSDGCNVPHTVFGFTNAHKEPQLEKRQFLDPRKSTTLEPKRQMTEQLCTFRVSIFLASSLIRSDFIRINLFAIVLQGLVSKAHSHSNWSNKFSSFSFF